MSKRGAIVTRERRMLHQSTKGPLSDNYLDQQFVHAICSCIVSYQKIYTLVIFKPQNFVGLLWTMTRHDETSYVEVPDSEFDSCS